MDMVLVMLLGLLRKLVVFQAGPSLKVAATLMVNTPVLLMVC
jgi:hypothetical protein